MEGCEREAVELEESARAEMAALSSSTMRRRSQSWRSSKEVTWKMSSAQPSHSARLLCKEEKGREPRD